jgi:hypothetical protein
MRTPYFVALLALCLTALAGCGADNDPVGVNTLPTDPAFTTEGADGRGAGDHAPCGSQCADRENHEGETR